MDVYELLDQTEDALEASKRVPLSGKVILEKDVFLNYIDKIRGELPEEMGKARRIVAEKEKILEDARIEAQETLDNIKAKIQRIAGESELVREAQAQADLITQEALRVSQEIKTGANRYADDILASLEENILKAHRVIVDSRDELKSMQQQKEAVNNEDEIFEEEEDVLED